MKPIILKHPFSLSLKFKQKLLLFFCFNLLIGCTTFKTALFDQHSYEKAISVKVESINLMEKATEPYDLHANAVETVVLNAKKLYEYEKNKPDNESTTKMWATLLNENKNLLSGFFKRWKSEDKLTASFTTQAIQQIEEAMDILLKFEAQKNKTNKTILDNFITKTY